MSVHFSKRTNENYLREAYKKVCKIHSSAPSGGGILVFLTGRQEVNSLCRMLREKFPFRLPNQLEEHEQKNSAEEGEEEGEKKNEKEEKGKSADKKNSTSASKGKNTINLDLYSVTPTAENKERVLDDFDYSDDESEKGDKEDESDQEEEDDDEREEVTTNEPLYCLPLYSMLPNQQQALVFKEPPAGSRLCVVATNVAETSLTIPNVKYVVDTGKVIEQRKDRFFENLC